MKTLHRVAYELLTSEEYKRFCRIPAERFFPESLDHDYSFTRMDVTKVVSASFIWSVNCDDNDPAAMSFWGLGRRGKQ